MINEVFALLIMVISPILKQYSLFKLQTILLFVLFIPLFGFLNYSYSSTDGATTYTYHSAKFNGLSPIVFVIILIYLTVNISAIKSVFKRTLYESEAQLGEKFDKMIEFYYLKFKECSDEEFTEVKSRYDHYPLEAREAIDKINKERS